MRIKSFSHRSAHFMRRNEEYKRRLKTTARAKEELTKLDLEEPVKEYVAELQSEMVELIHANLQTRRRDIRWFC
jgi:hypothetical protein